MNVSHDNKQHIYRPIPRRPRPGEHPLGHHVHRPMARLHPSFVAPATRPAFQLHHRPSPSPLVPYPSPSLLPCPPARPSSAFAAAPSPRGGWGSTTTCIQPAQSLCHLITRPLRLPYRGGSQSQTLAPSHVSPHGRAMLPRNYAAPPTGLPHNYAGLRLSRTGLSPPQAIGGPPAPPTPYIANPPVVRYHHHHHHQYHHLSHFTRRPRPTFTPVYLRDFKHTVASFPNPSSVRANYSRPPRHFNPQQQLYQSHRDFPAPPTHLIQRQQQQLYYRRTYGRTDRPGQCVRNDRPIHTLRLSQPGTARLPAIERPMTMELQYTQDEIERILAQYRNNHLPLGMPLSTEKPPYSLSALIGMAIKSSRHEMATTTDIYTFITSRFPYYDKNDKSWKSCIKKLLSDNECFEKAPFAPSGDKVAKRTYWLVNPYSGKNFMRGSFKKMKKTSRKRCRDGRSIPTLSIASTMLMYPEEFSVETIANRNTDIKELFPPAPKRLRFMHVLINSST